MFSNVFVHAFIKDNKLTIIFNEKDHASYRLAKKHDDKYVCSVGMIQILNGKIHLSNIEGEHTFAIKM